MSVFTIIAIPNLCVAAVLLYLAYKKREKNFLIPSVALLTTGFVNLVIGLASGAP